MLNLAKPVSSINLWSGMASLVRNIVLPLQTSRSTMAPLLSDLPTFDIAPQRKTVSVVGAGPAGYALAVDLENHHTDVLVYSHPSHQRHTQGIATKGTLRTKGLIESCVLPRVALDMGEVVAFSKVIIFTVPSTGQETIWRELSKFDLRRHTIILIPGNLFSLMVEFPIEAEYVLETNLSPYSCRMDQGELVVMGRKTFFSIAMLGDEQSPVVMQKVRNIFPMQLHWRHNIIEVCLSNINGVFHPLMVLMNAGRIESTGGDFFFYADGLTRSVANAILAVDQVRMEIGKAFRFRIKSVVEISNECYGHDFTDLVDLAQNSKPHRRLKAPKEIDSRNISEDVADLMVCWHGLAEKLGIDASPLTAVIMLASMATGDDYLRNGRTLAKLGLADIPRSELIRRYRVPECSSN